MAWTKEQEKAIYELRSKNAIVSAGAGSGKTAVLTERTYNIIKNKEAKVDELLILTFTNAAAHEMKDRIMRKLRDNNLYTLADQVEGSNVTTFDAYALSLVKKYNYYFDISKNISVIDENIISIKKQEIVNQLFEELYEKEDKDFIEMIHTFVTKNDQPLKDYVINILAFADNLANKDEYLENANKNLYTESSFNKVLTDFKNLICEQIKIKNDLAEHLENVDMIKAIQDNFRPILNSQSIEEFMANIASYNNISTRKKELKLEEDDKKFKTQLLDVDLKIKNFCDIDKLKRIYFNPIYHKANDVLFALTRELDKEIMKFKKQKNAYTFSDIAKMALILVKDPIINKELKSSIKFIMVDEYQDTSNIQEAFISALSNNNLFMVGDTKQSIYGFRGANCDIFQNKYDLYKDNKNGEKVDLINNYRSRKEIIEDINTIFCKVMSKKYGVVDYRIDHITKAGNMDYETIGKNDSNHHIEIYRFHNDKKIFDDVEYEARLIAQDILKRYKEDQIFDKRLNALRKANYQDFAIIVDKRKYLDTFQKVFDEYKIPVSIDKSKPLITSKVGFVFSNSLLLISKIHENLYDNEFKHALIALMRSFVYRLDDSTIYDVIINDNYQNVEPFIAMQNIAKNLDDLSLFQVVLKIYEYLDIYNKLVYIGDVENNEDALDALIDVSKTMEDLDYSFQDFIAYIKNLKSAESDFDKEIKQSINGVVVTVTMHRSKGLEYPVVYTPCLDANFNRGGGVKSSFRISKKYGLLFPIVNENNYDFLNVLTFLHDENEKAMTLSEKIRLFYVALTRAREKAIIILNDKEDSIFDISSVNTFHKLVSYFQNNSRVPLKETLKTIDTIHISDENKNDYYDNLVSLDTNIPINNDSVIEKKKASKKLDANVNYNILEFGTKLHYLLELVDFKTKDTTFIKDYRLRKHIEEVLKLDMFKNLDNVKVYKEYSFYDEDNNLTGTIDLMLVGEDIKIIDYKTKNIDDEQYKIQLKYYKEFISRVFNKNVTTYLLSILNREIKMIDL